MEIEVVLSPESISVIREWNPELARNLEFFDRVFDRDCYFLEKLVGMLTYELRGNREFKSAYEEAVPGSSGV